MKRDGGHRVHVWLRDVFDHNGDVVVPTSYRFVVRCRDESSILINKRDGIDWS